MKSINVAIGIQARSGPSKTPKIFAKIDGVEVIQHVVDRCVNAATYLNRHSHKSGIIVTTHILCPHGDDLVKKYIGRIGVMQGDEENVLSRYVTMAETLRSDYTVRITSDCPFIPPYLISKAIKIAIEGKYDYFSNVDEEVRTSPDGHDVEVMSTRAVEWLALNATGPESLEHVTLEIRRKRPKDLNLGTTLGWEDYSKLIKFSVDTADDLRIAQLIHEELEKKFNLAKKLYGRQNVHRY